MWLLNCNEYLMDIHKILQLLDKQYPMDIINQLSVISYGYPLRISYGYPLGISIN